MKLFQLNCMRFTSNKQKQYIFSCRLQSDRCLCFLVKINCTYTLKGKRTLYTAKLLTQAVAAAILAQSAVVALLQTALELLN